MTDSLFGAGAGVAGAAGAPGAPGAPGANGTNGHSVLNGSGAPSGGTGSDGDFYIDTVASKIYGPKTAGVWGSGTSLIGPTGPAGSVSSNFKSAILALSPSRLYALSNAGSGTTETDLGSDGQNGTWSATGAVQTTGMVIGDTAKAALLDGSTGQLSMPNTGFPTGAGHFSIGMVYHVIALPGSGVGEVWMIGQFANNQKQIDVDLNSTNTVAVTWTSEDLSKTYANIVATVWRQFTIVVYDGVTMKWWNNGIFISSASVTMNLTHPNAGRIGCNTNTGSLNNFSNIAGQYFFILNGTVLTPAQIHVLQATLEGN